MAVHGSVLIGAGLNVGRVTLKITFLLKFLLYHLKFSSDFLRDKSSELALLMLCSSNLILVNHLNNHLILLLRPHLHHQTFHYLQNEEFFFLGFLKSTDQKRLRKMLVCGSILIRVTKIFSYIFVKHLMPIRGFLFF